MFAKLYWQQKNKRINKEGRQIFQIHHITVPVCHLEQMMTIMEEGQNTSYILYAIILKATLLLEGDYVCNIILKNYEN